ncbi:MAG: ATP-binding cassette domain-containing protein, partial [Moorella sp. (in: Bacteria)]|nr:ATP-binding cassette domain-containing protein [Moorella sp. (in: firmicutes)]
MLEVKNVHSYYGLSHVLFGVSLEVHRGEVVCLLGRNGAGKTTTLRSIMGLTPPRQGSVKYKGIEITGKPPYHLVRLGICYVPDNRRIFPDLTVAENLEVAERKTGDGRGWTRERVYALFPALKKIERRRGGYLSGGEQQMLA